MNTILSIKNLNKTFGRGKTVIEAVKDVSLAVREGECLAIVGESGSGKTTVANMILGVLQPTSGVIELDGVALPPKRTLEHRRAIQLVQQNPLSSLNPKRSVGASIRLGLDVYNIGDQSSRWGKVESVLADVGLDPDLRKRSPAALSGGQRQRVAIARALVCDSRVIVLDEPTSALDVLVQARVLRLLDTLRRNKGLTYIFITHDLSVVRNIADRVAVFNAGSLVEFADTETLFASPKQDYTRQLISAVPVLSAEELRFRSALQSSV